MSQTSEPEFVRKFTSISARTGSQLDSISAASDSNPDENPFTVEFTGSRAVEDCVQAYNEAYRRAIHKHENETAAHKAGSKAYRQLIPALHNSCNIADFIACVGHGLVLGIIQGTEATRLLYAAQVAHSAIPSFVREWPRPRRGRPSAETEPIAAAPQTYLGPEDDWAGITDPGLRKWYNTHFPNPNRPNPENQSSPANQ